MSAALKPAAAELLQQHLKAGSGFSLRCSDGVNVNMSKDTLTWLSPVLEESCKNAANSGAKHIMVKEPWADWQLLLAAALLPLDEDVYNLFNAYRLAEMANAYQVECVLHLVANLVVLPAVEEDTEAACRLRPGDGRIVDVTDLHNPRHILQLLNLAHQLKHGLACSQLEKLIQRYLVCVEERIIDLKLLNQRSGASPNDASTPDPAEQAADSPADPKAVLPFNGLSQASFLTIVRASSPTIYRMLEWSGALTDDAPADAMPTALGCCDRLKQLRRNGDVILDCKLDGALIRTHKELLRQHSTVLWDMLADSASSPSQPATLPVHDKAAAWRVALALMYPTAAAGQGCPARMVPAVLQLADKYNMQIVRTRVLKHWSVARNFDLFLTPQGDMSAGKTRVALRLLSELCQEDHTLGESRCKRFLDWHMGAFLDLLGDEGAAAQLPELSPPCLLSLASLVVREASRVCPQHAPQELVLRYRVGRVCVACTTVLETDIDGNRWRCQCNPPVLDDPDEDPYYMGTTEDAACHPWRSGVQHYCFTCAVCYD